MSRSLKKGPFVDEHLMKKVEALNESGKKEVIKTCFNRNEKSIRKLSCYYRYSW